MEKQTGALVSRLINADGTVAVNPKKCPTLHRCLTRGMKLSRDGWQKVVDLRREGKESAADRQVRELLGIKGPEMSEETKVKLREYNEAHKEEISARRKTQRAIRRAISKPRSGKAVRS